MRETDKKTDKKTVAVSVEENIQNIKKMIKKSKNIVCLLGVGTAMECGATNFCNQNVVYEIEEKYHYSPEEIYSSGFYSARSAFFYRYYKDEVLAVLPEPNETYRALKKLEDTGRLLACITNNIYSLPSKAGIKNVIELQGNIYRNYCSKCQREYSVEYIKQSKDVPKCEKCKAIIRPAVKLQGEMIRNDLMTAAANACQQADLLLILGTNLYDPFIKGLTKYYQSDQLVVISKKEHYSDKKATIVINDRVENVFGKIVS